MEIARPGPHAFILSLAVKRFTKEEKDCVNVLIKYFGLKLNKKKFSCKFKFSCHGFFLKN
jgi:hypothetical protein